jgi:hypothetical protein
MLHAVIEKFFFLKQPALLRSYNTTQDDNLICLWRGIYMCIHTYMPWCHTVCTDVCICMCLSIDAPNVSTLQRGLGYGY